MAREFSTGILTAGHYSGVVRNLERFTTDFTGPNPNRFIQRRYKDLAVSDLASLGGLQNRIHNFFDVVFRADNFHFDLGDEIDGIFRTAVHFRVTFLASKTADLGDGHSVDTALRKRIFYVFQFEVTNDGFDFFHFNSQQIQRILFWPQFYRDRPGIQSDPLKLLRAKMLPSVQQGACDSRINLMGGLSGNFAVKEAKFHGK